MAKEYSGGCLCGHIRYSIKAEPTFPHLCSCSMCAKSTGALTVAWVDFPAIDVDWNGEGHEPAFYHSSTKMKRGFCATCGGSVCSIEKDSDKICITIASLDAPCEIIPGEQHSYHEEMPLWWKVEVVR